MEEIDEEDYWGTSNVQRSIKKKDIFSDFVTIDDASSIAKFKRESEVEKINWDDTPVINRAERALSQPKTHTIPDPVLSISQVKAHSRSRSDVLVSSNKATEKPKSSLNNQPAVSIDANTTNMIDLNPQINCTTAEKGEQLNYLKDRLRQVEDGFGISKLKVEESVKRMVNGQPFSLEQYKSKDEKLELLDKAIKTHDGNAIIAVVIFLKRTLSEQIFYYELTRRQDAVDQYLAYLKAHFNTRELEYMLEKLNRAEEISMLRYKQAASVENPDAKINKLEQCLRTYFENNPNLDHNASLIRQQISLLQRQRPVDVGDDMLEKQGRHVALPRTRPVTNLPLLTTLFYCCIYHYEEPENLLSSPTSIRKDHQLTEKQYVWTALRARAKMKKWADIDGLFTTKGWLGGTKMRSVIGFDKVSAVLHRFEAPSSVLCKYLMLVDDVEKRLDMAFKMNSHKAVIETYAAQRDRRSLESYQNKLKLNSEEWFYCKDVLNSNSIKWK